MAIVLLLITYFALLQSVEECKENWNEGAVDLIYSAANSINNNNLKPTVTHIIPDNASGMPF